MRNTRRTRIRLILAGTLAVLMGLSTFWLFPGYLAWQAISLMKSSRLLLAAEYFKKAELKISRDPEFLIHRARLHRKISEFDEMSKVLEKAVTAGASPLDISTERRMADAQRGNLSSLEPELPRLFSNYRDPDEVCEAFVLGCLLKYRLQDAMELISVWEADFPNDDRANYLRGRILEHRQNLDDALFEYEAALGKNSYNAAASFSAGRVLSTKKDLEAALSRFLDCSKTLGDPRPGLIAAAGCCRILGRLDETKKYITLAEGYSKGDLLLAYRLVGETSESAKARLATERGELAFLASDFSAAADFFQTAVDTSPADWRVRYRLSQAQEKVGRTVDAKATADRVKATRAALEECDPLITLLKREPNNVDARFRIGITFLEHVSFDQGIIWLDSVLDIDPDHQGAHEALATHFEKHQNENSLFKTLAAQHRVQLHKAKTPQ